MASRGLENNGYITRKTFVSSEIKTSHAMKVTKNSQDLFRDIEKTPVRESARESFKRKPYSI